MFDMIQTLINDSSFKSSVKHQTIKFAANQKILKQGKKHTDFYLILKGKVKIVVSKEELEPHHEKEKNNNKEKHSVLHPAINELGPQNIFGEFALFDKLPASADVITVVDSELVVIDIISFQQFLEKHKEIGYLFFHDILKSMIKHLRHADKSIVIFYEWGIKAHKLESYLE